MTQDSRSERERLAEAIRALLPDDAGDPEALARRLTWELLALDDGGQAGLVQAATVAIRTMAGIASDDEQKIADQLSAVALGGRNAATTRAAEIRTLRDWIGHVRRLPAELRGGTLRRMIERQWGAAVDVARGVDPSVNANTATAEIAAALGLADDTAHARKFLGDSTTRKNRRAVKPR